MRLGVPLPRDEVQLPLTFANARLRLHPRGRRRETRCAGSRRITAIASATIESVAPEIAAASPNSVHSLCFIIPRFPALVLRLVRTPTRRRPRDATRPRRASPSQRPWRPGVVVIRPHDDDVVRAVEVDVDPCHHPQVDHVRDRARFGVRAFGRLAPGTE